MNITELARNLKITPQELRDYLPELGYDIGQRAIKVNKNVASRIIRDWPTLRRKIEIQKQMEMQEEEKEVIKEKIQKKIRVPSYITVKEFAALSDLPVNIVLTVLLKNSIFVSLNEKIDFETAWLIGSELGLDVKKKNDETSGETENRDKLKDIMAEEKEEDLAPRPPVIVVMGHVDHGKTKLLDAIRHTNVVDGEAGGITQHIGAYQVTRKNQLITFIDTPGHEAFTAMRSRGARIADIAILVIAADDGVKPQTIEAFRIIEAAHIPYVIAINKTDKPDANIEKTKQELSSQLKIVPEDWGGQTVCVPVSAKAGTGINDLLDMVLLTAETGAKDVKANPNSDAVGTVIESHVNKGAGPVATILIQNGTLHLGEQLVSDGISIGKVRALKNYRNETINSAKPSTPVQILGLKNALQVGDILEVGEGVKHKLRRAKAISRISSPQEKAENSDAETTKTFTLIIRADVLGSAEAIEESLMKINTKEIKVKIIHKGLGNITDGDIKRAEASGSLILGFNVKVPTAIEEIARDKNIEIRLYKIIYDLIGDIKERLQAMVEPEIKIHEIGRMKVLKIFQTGKNDQIVGGKISDGKTEISAMVEVRREGKLIGKGSIKKLQSGKQDVSQCQAGEECGLQYIGDPIIEIDDKLHFYREEKIITKL